MGKLLVNNVCSLTNTELNKNLYYLYEYTDDVNVIADSSQYPTLLNYVKTGLLTEDEMLEALLHK